MLRLWWIAALLLNGVLHSLADDGKAWGYYNVRDDEQPSRWGKSFKVCDGKKQSPIHIYTKQVVYDDSLVPFKLTGWDRHSSSDAIVMENNGHTVKFQVHENTQIFVEGGGLKEKYKLRQFHVHWGEENNKGSEHWVDNVHYAAEIHFVCFNTNYEDDDVLNHSDGLAVLGVIIQVAGNDNENLMDITEHLKNVAYADSEPYHLKPFTLRKILPADINSYYRYEGSLTTPPCTEAVIWTVFEKPIQMSQAQITKFRNDLHHSTEAKSGTESDYKLVDNHRLPQDLNGRIVKASTARLATSAANKFTSPIALIALIMAIRFPRLLLI